MRNLKAQAAAAEAARFITKQLGVKDCATGVVLGTGWGKHLDLTDERAIRFERVPGFEQLEPLEGHARKIVWGMQDGIPVLALDGRVHLNEATADPAIPKMVRLQTEILMQLGVSRLIVTCAAGSLPQRKLGFLWRNDIGVGTLVVIDGFVTTFAPDMPLWTGEFCNPEDALCRKLQDKALKSATFYTGGKVQKAGYAMVRGPFFEGRLYDKRFIAKTGASIVGMSTVPEACVASLYGAKVLALAFVTNDCLATHSHEGNLARAAESSKRLGGYLRHMIKAIWS